jgi:pilus assembly protein TadC
MAQARRKRRTKHRGTPAGTIEARGRTGRPPTADERKRQTRASARQRRLNTPPAWKSSVTRAMLAGILVFAFLLLTAKGKNRVTAAVIFTLVAVAIYIPAGYYLELMLYRRRQRRKAGEGDASRKTGGSGGSRKGGVG